MCRANGRLLVAPKNYDVVSIFNDMPSVTDDIVLQKAFQEKRILITGDKDFGDMVFRQSRQHCGIVLLRLLDQFTPNKIRVLEWLLNNHLQDVANNFIVVNENLAVRIIKF
jgi:predicted nuclease of predicted toxin-antitoxin system